MLLPTTYYFIWTAFKPKSTLESTSLCKNNDIAIEYTCVNHLRCKLRQTSMMTLPFLCTFSTQLMQLKHKIMTQVTSHVNWTICSNHKSNLIITIESIYIFPDCVLDYFIYILFFVMLTVELCSIFCLRRTNFSTVLTMDLKEQQNGFYFNLNYSWTILYIRSHTTIICSF